MATTADAPGVAVETTTPSNGDKIVETKETNGSTENAKTETGGENGNDRPNGELDKQARDEKQSDRDVNGHRGRGDNDRRRGGGGKFRGNRGGGGGSGRGGGRGGGKNGRYNVKTRFDSRPESNDAEEIRRQVEFYFSDSNLPIDKFLLSEVGGVENKPIPLKVIHNFKRMRNFQPFSAIVDAVKGSDFLEVNDKDEVQRKKPIAAHFTLSVDENEKLLTSDSMKRSIYAKGFGCEEESTAFDIEEFFQPYGIKGVRLRRHNDKTFKGSVFVEFLDEETAQTFLDLEEKPKFKDNELLIKSKKAYVDEKNEAIKNGDIRPQSQTRYNDRKRGNRNGPRDNKRRRHDDDDDKDDKATDPDNWRARRDKFQDKRRKGNDGKRQDDEKDGKDDEKKEGETETASKKDESDKITSAEAAPAEPEASEKDASAGADAEAEAA